MEISIRIVNELVGIYTDDDKNAIKNASTKVSLLHRLQGTKTKATLGEIKPILIHKKS